MKLDSMGIITRVHAKGVHAKVVHAEGVPEVQVFIIMACEVH